MTSWRLLLRDICLAGSSDSSNYDEVGSDMMAEMFGPWLLPGVVL